MDNLWAKLAEQAPYMVIIVLLVIVFLRYIEKIEERRVNNAKELEASRQAHEDELEEKRETHNREINAMWAGSIKLVTDQQKAMQEAFLAALKDHEEKSRERYEKMGITKDLLEAAKERERERRK